MSKIADVNAKIAEGAVKVYRKIENGVVSGYKKVEDTVVGGYKKVEDSFVDKFIAGEGESAEEAKARIAPKL
ncbi:hypothetical protein [Ruminococcus sp.]|uniref:hypothetical protein n=1 Tax=Ruminococcus sp. TaxID=41978 RepID=UPI0025CF4011|nr:hypothetical protein [Ruminococcus sp.]MBQ8966660.1 hypothetical protein [Ruminococcus sp.]